MKSTEKLIRERVKALEEENKLLKEYRESYRKELDYWRIQFSNKQERIDKAIEYINENKNKTIAPYGDNEDIDYETCLFEEDIINLLQILQGEDND